jgi:hypothetical protein
MSFRTERDTKKSANYIQKQQDGNASRSHHCTGARSYALTRKSLPLFLTSSNSAATDYKVAALWESLTGAAFEVFFLAIARKLTVVV